MDRTSDAREEPAAPDDEREPAPAASAASSTLASDSPPASSTVSLSSTSSSTSATSVPSDSSVVDSAAASANAPHPPRSSFRALMVRLRTLYVRITDRYPFPKLPPAPRGNRIALAAVALLALAFVVYFVAFTWAKHDAYQTFAEDMGIMDQALWNLMHGYGLRQTICNPIGDTNCLGDVSRLAIHFEPIMYVIGLIYLVAPSPKTLQLLQAVVVATGAFPAYAIAARRLRSALAGLAFVAVYLLFPALQAAVTYDFHAVTLSAAFLMFALYFMLTRNNVGLVIACVLAMSTKENIPLDVIMIGASVALLQRRWRIGLALCAVALIWLGVELPIMHAASPVGYSPTAGRYTYLGSSPVKAAVYLLTHPLQVIREHVLDPGGRYYLRALLSPTAYLAPLGPFALLMAVPAIAINILSTYPSQRTGLYHYNAEIVPFLVFATIEAVAWIAALAARIGRSTEKILGPRAPLATPRARIQQVYARASGALPARLVSTLAHTPRPHVSLPAAARWLATMALVALVLLFSMHEQQTRGYLPFSTGFAWPQETTHTRLAERFIQMIPARASVSAQSELAPHISQRRFIYQFPFADTSADYVFLDITASPYPYYSTADYFTEVQRVLTSGNNSVVAAQDGYLLLRRGVGPNLNPANPYGLPEALFSFAEQPTSAPVPHHTQARFGPSLQLVGYDITPTTHPIAQTFITVTTYWQVTGPVGSHDQIQLLLARPDHTYVGLSSFAATALQPLSNWRAGVTYVVEAPIYITAHEAGRDLLSVRVQSGAGQSPADYLHATLSAPGVAGGFPKLDPDQNQAIFAEITV